MESLKTLDKMYVFGAGDGAIKNWIIAHYEKKIICYLDNDSTKWGKKINGRGIFSPEIIQNNYDENAKIVISTYWYWDEIEKQLVELGAKKENIIIAKKDVAEFSCFEFRLFEQGVIGDNYNPHTCTVELSGICNCRCTYCPFHGKQNIKDGEKSLMTWETLRKVVEQLKKIPTLKTITTIGAGETFINPDWYEMSRYILEETGITDLAIYTNGLLLNAENVRKIMSLPAKVRLDVSIDGRTPEDNDRLRVGSDYLKIRENVYKAMEIREELNSDIEILITNCHPIKRDELSQGDMTVYPYELPYTPDFLNKDFPKLRKISKYTLVYRNNKLEDPFGGMNCVEVHMPEDEGVCTYLFTNMAINNKGELERCACGNAGIETFGNVFDDDILELWKNDPVMKQARENFLYNKVANDFCYGCPQKGGGAEYYLYLDE